jgi:hypothetical protein
MLDRAEIVTGPGGEAEVAWTLGHEAGEQVLQARAEGAEVLEVGATAMSGAPAGLVVVRGDDQIGKLGETLDEPLTVRVRDRFWNGVPGVSVEWSLNTGLAELSSESSMTDGAGLASVDLTLADQVGTGVVQASHGVLAAAEFEVLGLSAVFEDPVGDTFTDGLSGDWVITDVVKLGAGWDGDQLVVGMTFAGEVHLAASGELDALRGLLDFDTDVNPETGLISAVDLNRPAEGHTGMGVDVYIGLSGTNSGLFQIWDSANLVIGFITPSFHGKLVRFEVPSSMLGDGPLTMAVIVATPREPTDIAPDDGNVFVGAADGARPVTLTIPARRPR